MKTLLPLALILLVVAVCATCVLPSTVSEAVPQLDAGLQVADAGVDSGTPTDAFVVSEEDVLPPVAVVQVRPQTAVQAAPSFYNDYFSELRGERRRARFSRTEPEIMNLRGDPELEAVTVLVLARLCLSEANWLHDDRLDRGAPGANHAELDCPAIYQVLRHTRSSGQTLLGAIRGHAHYVTEARTPRGPRMRWIVQMQLEGRRPHDFPATDRNGNPLNWERDYRPRWLALVEFVRGLLRGEHLGPCAGAPISAWGGRCDVPGGACDDGFARRRGLVPYERCGDTANRFWCNPRSAACPQQEGDADAPAQD